MVSIGRPASREDVEAILGRDTLTVGFGRGPSSKPLVLICKSWFGEMAEIFLYICVSTSSGIS